MAPTNAFDSGSESDGDDLNLSFKVNEQFANKYDTKKRGEELSKLQDKYGKDYQFSDEDDSEDLSDDDEDAEFVTPEVDAAILATLAKIRAKDPSVYESGRNVFDEEEARTSTFSTSGPSSSRQKTSSSKPVLLKDFQRARLLANPTDDGSLDDDNFGGAGAAGAGLEPTPVQEQAALKREIKAAFAAAGASDSEDEGGEEDEEGGGMFRKREKGEGEREKEEREYEKFLETAVGKKAVKEALGNEEAFLRDYILNRGWIDREASPSHIPSYEEIVGDSEPKKKSKKTKSNLLEDIAAHDDEDEEFEERADEYETKYNFRFEQEGAADLVTHARDSISSVRKPTTAVSARARAREAAKQRKEEEKLQRKEEVRRLKALKRKEVEEKLLQLVEAGGAKGLEGLEEELDLEGDWDEKKHEEAMRKVYGEEYEGAEDDGFKPTWDDDIDITDIVGEDASDVDDDEVMQYLPVASTSALPDGAEEEEEDEEEDAPMGNKSKKSKKDKKDGSSKKRKRDEEGLPTELLEAARAGGDAERAQLLDRMVDEYYSLDYEDRVGDVKTRFKYAKVAPSSFNLTPEEILLATDAELNAFMSLKKLAPYRQDSPAWLKKEHEKQRKKVKELRDALRNRKWGEEVDEDLAERLLEERKEKKKKYKNKDKKKEGGEGVEQGEGGRRERGGEGEPPKKKKRAGKSERKRLAKEAAEGNGGAAAAE
ncbi:hypothetical protein JCM11251_004278 [Rhodosporidiobolus azoricus]